MNKELIEQSTIFLCISGSHAYGTSTPTSDVDVRGVCIIPDRTYYMGYGLHRFEQMDKGWEDDRVIYDVRKFISLAAECNPNIIELLFMPSQFILFDNEYWNKIAEHRQKFLSKVVKHRYLGYAFAQIKRIKSHRGFLLAPPKKKPERSDFGLPEKKLITADHLGAYQWLLANLLKGSIDEMGFTEAAGEEIKNINWIGLIQSKIDKIPQECHRVLSDLSGASDEFIEVMMQEKTYINAMNNWNAYQDWQTRRNQSRKELELQFGFDTKFAMHAIRLLRQGMEILETEQVNVFRPDREELIAIRNGAWSYEQIVEHCEDCEKRFAQLYESSTLPKQPDRTFLDKLCYEIVEEYLREH